MSGATNSVPNLTSYSSFLQDLRKSINCGSMVLKGVLERKIAPTTPLAVGQLV